MGGISDDKPDPRQMHEITLAIEALKRGDPTASDDLIKLVYAELRQLARARLAKEPGGGAGMTLEATALVHEAYLRVIGNRSQQKAWDGRGHFFGAAALAMRRILIERARHQRRLKHGGGRERIELDDELAQLQSSQTDGTDLIALDDALTRLEARDPRKAKLVALRYFVGLSIEETAAAMDLSPATVKTEWAFARAWLHREIEGKPQPEK